MRKKHITINGKNQSGPAGYTIAKKKNCQTKKKSKKLAKKQANRKHVNILAKKKNWANKQKKNWQRKISKKNGQNCNKKKNWQKTGGPN